MSLLNTLLEAAKFLELQEQQDIQSQTLLDTTLVNKIPIVPVSHQPVTIASSSHLTTGITHSIPTTVIHKTIGSFSQFNPHQTVVITTANLDANGVLQAGQIGQVALTAVPTTNGVKKDAVAPVQVPSGSVHPRHRVLHNSFDIMNPLVIDETNEGKRRQPPLVFRAGTREVHNKLEKHRRAHLKECFDILKKQLPTAPDEKKTSNLNILHSAIRYIQALRRKERELEHEMERLAREKIAAQSRLATLKKEITAQCDNVDFSKLLPDIVPLTTLSGSFGENDLGNHVTVYAAEPEGDGLVITEEISDGVCRTTTAKLDGSDFTEATILPIATSGTNLISQATKIELITARPHNGTSERISFPVLTNKGSIPLTTAVKEMTQLGPAQHLNQQQSVQTTALSVLPVSYPINNGLVLQKLSLVPKSLSELTPLVPTFITQQQLNGKVVPLVNAQYVVKPLVVVSTASPRPS